MEISGYYFAMLKRRICFFRCAVNYVPRNGTLEDREIKRVEFRREIVYYMFDFFNMAAGMKNLLNL